MKRLTQRGINVWLTCVVLVLVVSCSTPDGPDSAAVSSSYFVPAGPVDIAPVRGPVRPLGVLVDGEYFNCSICHEGFEGTLTEEALAGTHATIAFDHGRNVRCLNCHNPQNSDAYVDFDGSEIPSDNPTMLCSKCHGPHYREWSLDVHGRVMGYWDQAFGEQQKLACVQCHDPHKPRFPAMTPMPPPVLTRFDLVSADGGPQDGH